MPLPTANVEWPPAHCRKAADHYQVWGAWYAGDPRQLMEVYAHALMPRSSGDPYDPRAIGRPAQYLGGIAGQAPRMFWGVPPAQGGITSAKLHVPIAADVSSTSADLLFGEPPKPRFEESEPTQEFVETLMGEGGLHAVLLEGAELASAYGGVYYRALWDETISDRVLYDAIPPDAAVPEWRHGHLVAVTFWREIGRDDGHIWRHLERHEKGRVLHGLYRGDGDHLGRPANLKERPETEPFAALVDSAGGMPTGSDLLTAQYMQNMLPNRVMRGSPLGRSDYSGIEPLMDAIDETWTSLMRDLRLGKGRLIVPDQMLQALGPGRGAMFDGEQEVFTGVQTIQSASTAGVPVHNVQFQIRVAEHMETLRGLAEAAWRGAGYSAATFGEGGDVAATATEAANRQKHTNRTRARKIDYARRPVGRLIHAGIDVQIGKFGTDGLKSMAPDLEWPDAVTVDPEQKARTLQILRAAELMSRETGVRELHPDWDDPAVQKELERIDLDTAAPAEEVPEPGAGTTGTPAAGEDGAKADLQRDLIGGRPAAPTGPNQAARPAPTAPRPVAAGVRR